MPDAVTGGDIRAIARAAEAFIAVGGSLVVRSAAPLAAELVGVASRGLLPIPLLEVAASTLLVVGSHIDGAARQLSPVIERFGEPAVFGTAEALLAPALAGRDAAERARVTRSHVAHRSHE